METVKQITINNQTLHVIFGKTLNEWNLEYTNDDGLWDFSLEDIADNAIEVNPSIIYWFINGRFYETDQEI